MDDLNKYIEKRKKKTAKFAAAFDSSYKDFKKKEQLIDEIVELDRINMSSIIEAQGGMFDEDRRRNSLVADLSKGLVIIPNIENEQLIAYLELLQIDNRNVKVRSIQIHPGCNKGLALKKLFSRFLEFFPKNTLPEYFCSKVHKANTKSLALHKKLGFTRYKTDDDSDYFKVQGNTLYEYIKRFEKNE